MPDTVLRDQLRELVNERRRFGYRPFFIHLRREGEPSGINRIYRFHARMAEDQRTVPGTVFSTTLTVRKRKARRKAIGTRGPLLVVAPPNARWSLE